MLATRMKIYDFIVKFITEKHYSPSFQNIADAVRIKSRSTIAYHIKKLEDQGLIKFDHSKFRSIRILEK